MQIYVIESCIATPYYAGVAKCSSASVLRRQRRITLTYFMKSVLRGNYAFLSDNVQ